MTDAVFCHVCNYAVAKVCVEQARVDFRCSRCGGSKLSEHYELGSVAHKRALFVYTNEVRYVGNGVVALPPPSLPKPGETTG